MPVVSSYKTPPPPAINHPGRHLAALPLSRLPLSCGYTVKSTQQDLVVVAPYDGCFVTQEVGRLTHLLRLCSGSATCTFPPFVSGGQLRSSHALVGPVGEDVVPAGQTMFIQTADGHLLR